MITPRARPGSAAVDLESIPFGLLLLLSFVYPPPPPLPFSIAHSRSTTRLESCAASLGPTLTDLCRTSAPGRGAASKFCCVPHSH